MIKYAFVFFLLVSAFLFGRAAHAQAASHTYTCAEIANPGDSFFGLGGSCTGSTVNAVGTYLQVSDGGNTGSPVFPMSDGITYYVSYVQSGSGDSRYSLNQSGNAGAYVFVSGATSVVEAPYTAGTSGGANNWGFTIDTPGSSLNGTITNICVDDDGSSCGGGGGVGGSGDLGAALAAASSTFETTTGFDLLAVLQWAGPNLFGLIIGNGLSSLYLLRGWIVAALVIGSILLFAMRGLRFFRL